MEQWRKGTQYFNQKRISRVIPEFRFLLPFVTIREVVYRDYLLLVKVRIQTILSYRFIVVNE